MPFYESQEIRFQGGPPVQVFLLFDKFIPLRSTRTLKPEQIAKQNLANIVSRASSISGLASAIRDAISATIAVMIL